MNINANIPETVEVLATNIPAAPERLRALVRITTPAVQFGARRVEFGYASNIGIDGGWVVRSKWRTLKSARAEFLILNDRDLYCRPRR